MAHQLSGLLYLIGGILLGLSVPRFYRSYGDGRVRARLDDIGMGWTFPFYRVLAMVWIVGLSAGLVIGGCVLLFGPLRAK